jgi:hypothetical protein
VQAPYHNAYRVQAHKTSKREVRNMVVLQDVLMIPQKKSTGTVVQKERKGGKFVGRCVVKIRNVFPERLALNFHYLEL